MHFNGKTRFLLTATNKRKTWNFLILDAILVDIHLKNKQKGINGISRTFHLPTNVFACN